VPTSASKITLCTFLFLDFFFKQTHLASQYRVCRVWSTVVPNIVSNTQKYCTMCHFCDSITN
jgi:hypothetical protein